MDALQRAECAASAAMADFHAASLAHKHAQELTRSFA